MSPPGLVCLICVALGQPEPDVSADEKALAEILMPYYQSEATLYRFTLDEAGQRPLELNREPVLKWIANSTPYMGAVFVWTRDGRPEVIGCIGSEQRENQIHRCFHEFHSLTLKPLPQTDVINNARRWKPAEPGLAFLDPAEEQAPATDERRRGFQMRNIARKVEASVLDEGKADVLRLMPQPLFRYASPNQHIVDGAIFSYVRGSGIDPEMLLIVEAVTEDGKDTWRYGFARFAWRPLVASYDGQMVWNVGENNAFWNEQIITQTYFSGQATDITRAEISARVKSNDAKPTLSR